MCVAHIIVQHAGLLLNASVVVHNTYFDASLQPRRGHITLYIMIIIITPYTWYIL